MITTSNETTTPFANYNFVSNTPNLDLTNIQTLNSHHPTEDTNMDEQNRATFSKNKPTYHRKIIT